MSTWKIGQKLVHAKLGAGLFDGTAVAFGQAHWESLGWTAVPEPAPVERTLAAGWRRGEQRDHWMCCLCRRVFMGSVPLLQESSVMFKCDACAEKAGAFADAPRVEPPAPAIKVTSTGSQPGTFGAPAKPAPVVEAPRCTRCFGRELVTMRFLRRSQPAAAYCEACYLGWERNIPQFSVDEVSNSSPSRPPGLVPQSFGDERIGGVWASRGMK